MAASSKKRKREENPLELVPLSPFEKPLKIKDSLNLLKDLRDDENILEVLTVDICEVLGRHDLSDSKEFIQAGGVPLLLQFFKHTNPQIQQVSVRTIEILTGAIEDLTEVTQAGTIDLLVDLLSPNYDLNVMKSVLGALIHIACTSTADRDRVLEVGRTGIFNKIDQIIQQHRSLKSEAIKTLLVLVGGRPYPPLVYQEAALPLFSRFLEDGNRECRTDACWGLTYITDGQNYEIQGDVARRHAGQLVHFIQQRYHRTLQSPAMRCLGNLTIGDQTQVVLDAGFLHEVHALVRDPRSETSFLKECCWVLSNITAGPSADIQAVIDAKIFDFFPQMLERKEEDLEKEMLWALSNATTLGTIEQLETIFVDHDKLLDLLVHFLGSNVTRMISVALEGLKNIFEKASTLPPPHSFALKFESEDEIFEKLEMLQIHSGVRVYEMAATLIEMIEESFGDDVSSVKPAKKD